MKKNIVILNSFLMLFCFSYLISCNKNTCYECTIRYAVVKFYNRVTNDTLVLITYSNNYAVDSIDKYNRLGYIGIQGLDYENVPETICPEDYEMLKKQGINYNCKY